MTAAHSAAEHFDAQAHGVVLGIGFLDAGVSDTDVGLLGFVLLVMDSAGGRNDFALVFLERRPVCEVSGGYVFDLREVNVAGKGEDGGAGLVALGVVEFAKLEGEFFEL